MTAIFQPTEMANLCEVLRDRAFRTPDKVAFLGTNDRESVATKTTYSSLYARSQEIAWGVGQQARRGERILLLFENGWECLPIILGCIAAGMTPVLGVPPHAPREGDIGDRHARRLMRLSHIVRAANIGAVLGAAKLLGRFRQGLEQEKHSALRWLATEDCVDRPSGEISHVADERETAFIQFTSGSTGSPRGVMLSHANLAHNLSQQRHAFDYSETDFGVSWLPFFHDMGLIGTGLAPLFSGFPCLYLKPEHFVEKPGRWIKAISDYRATLSWAPNFAYRLAAEKMLKPECEGLDLSSWRVAANSAEPVTTSVLELFEKTFAPCGFRSTSFQPCYGLAEATLLVTSRSVDQRWVSETFSKTALERRIAKPISSRDSQKDGQSLIACGQPPKDGNLVIVDPETMTECSDGLVGEILYQSPSVAAGFSGDTEAGALTFDCFLRDGRGPYLRTGDLGFLHNSELFIAGRSKDIIIIRGKNYYPQDLERACERSHPCLRVDGCVAFSLENAGREEFGLLCEIERSASADGGEVTLAIRRRITEEFRIEPSIVAIVRAGTTFKTPSGKVQRKLCKEAFLRGSLQPIYEWSRPAPAASSPLKSTSATVGAWLMTTMLKLDADPLELQFDRQWGEMGFDSVKLAELSAHVRDEWSLDIDLVDAYELGTLKNLHQWICEKLPPDKSE